MILTRKAATFQNEFLHLCVCVYTHTRARVYLVTNLFLTFIFKNWCLYMKHLGQCTSRAFIKVTK